MVTFNMCKNNPGAVAFMMAAYKEVPFHYAGMAFQKLLSASITGDKLYMIWNDCCDRDTKMAIWMILDNNIDTINYLINYENGRGLKYCPEVLERMYSDG